MKLSIASRFFLVSLPTIAARGHAAVLASPRKAMTRCREQLELGKEESGAPSVLARSGDEIWVAAGSYPNTSCLKDGVALYGGFQGDEIARDERSWLARRRSWTARPTV